ncbi:MAG TPA: DUF72 domain-containing protein [Polyangiaceae bacterium]|nr:DUF72 domain-containing protein [Polyangiaceae bacterium]
MSYSKDSPRVHVGRASLEGNIERYARSFNLLEVSGEQGRHPRRPGLLAWKRAVPEDFVFSVVVPPSVAELPSGGAEAQLAHAASVAESLGAAWWVLRTPPVVTPSARSLRALQALGARLSEGGRRIAWEPRGVWSDETAIARASELGFALVRDLGREDRLDDGPVVYTRLRALGAGARVGAAAAERVAERLEGVREAYVVVEGAGAGRVRQVLRDMLAAPPDDDFSDDDEDDVDSEDEPAFTTEDE